MMKLILAFGMFTIAGRVSSVLLAAITPVSASDWINVGILGAVATGAWYVRGLGDRIDTLWCQQNGNKRCDLKKAIGEVLDERLGK